MLPLVAILTLTAIKDGIEDYRRASLDEEVSHVFSLTAQQHAVDTDPLVIAGQQLGCD